MHEIWNGFSSAPYTLPDACLICAGSQGGDFIKLPCTHGGPEQGPMHVKCFITSLIPADPHDPQPPRCPIGREPVNREILNELAHYVSQGAVVSYPADHGQTKQVRIYKDAAEGIQLIRAVMKAQRRLPGGGEIQPTDDERHTAHWEDRIDELDERLQTLWGDIAEERYSPAEFEQQQSEFDALTHEILVLSGRITLFENNAAIFGEDPWDSPNANPVSESARLEESLERIDTFMHDERLALQRYQDDAIENVKTVWNGFDTAPLTKPSACSVCSGSKGGEFIILDCGHGAPENRPLHVQCALDRVRDSVIAGHAATCPTCEETLSSNTLSRLAERVGRDEWVKFPGEDGTRQTENLTPWSGRERFLIDVLLKAQDMVHGALDFSPWENELDDEYYNDMIDTIKDCVEKIKGNIAGQGYTQQELEIDRFRLNRIEERLQTMSGRTALLGKGSGSWPRDGDSFPKIYDRLRFALRHIKLTDISLRDEQEKMEREAAGRTGHPQRIWNGFDSDPLTRPRDCVACLGQHGGDFMSLDCGHGHPSNDPLHVRCLLEGATNAAQEGTMARCPVCSTSLSDDTLSRLSDCVERNKEVRFPNDAGQPETTRLFGEFPDTQSQQRKMLSALTTLHETRTDMEHEPKDEEINHDTSISFIQDIEKMVQEVMSGIESHAYTLEELNEKENTIDELDHRASVAAGRMAEFKNWMTNNEATSFEERYQRLLEARERLEETARRARQEKEEMKHREEEHAHHVFA